VTISFSTTNLLHGVR